MATTTSLPNSLDFSAARLKGRATGALICGIFGGVWMFEALYFGTMATPAWLTVMALLSATFVLWPVARLRSLRHVVSSDDYWATVSKAYWTIVAVEWLACCVAANVLANTGHPDLIPQFIGGIVGLHFLPLAKLFKAPTYNWTGAAMALGVLASFAIPAGTVRALAAYGLCGLVLWTTVAVSLCHYRLSSR